MVAGDDGRVYAFGDYRLDAGAQLLHCTSGAPPVSLTRRVFATLLFLVEHPGVVVDKATLMDAVWPDAVVEVNNLDQNISTLRKLLGGREAGSRYIVTVRGRGYRFVPRPELMPGSAAAPAALAVLPFRPLTADDRNESLELGMAETLIAGLNSGGLGVMPLSSVRRFAHGDEDPLLAGRAVGATSVLEGHLQRDGARLRVTARLLNVADGRQLWAGRFDEDFTDIFAVQDAIAAKVQAALAGTAGEPDANLRHDTKDAEAYQLYVNGRYYRQRANVAALRQALASFQQAVQRDPGFARAWVGLAEAWTILAVFGAAPPREVFPRAKAAVQKALELAPGLGEAHASLGHIRRQYDLDWDGAERAFRRAIALSPAFAAAHQWLGFSVALRGHFDEGISHMRRAQELEPGTLVYSATIGMLLNYERRYDEAVVYLENLLEMEPDLSNARTFLACSHLRLGEYGKALEHLDRLASSAPGSAAYRGQICALTGRRNEALAEIDRLTVLSEQGHAASYDIATIHAALGDPDQAFAWLDRAFIDRSQLIGWFPWDEIFDPLRSDARYPEILKRLGLP